LEPAVEPVSHEHRRNVQPGVVSELTDTFRARLLRRVAVIAGIALVIVIVIVMGIYFGAFVIVCP
jgi:hypothetical protein